MSSPTIFKSNSSSTESPLVVIPTTCHGSDRCVAKIVSLPNAGIGGGDCSSDGDGDGEPADEPDAGDGPDGRRRDNGISGYAGWICLLVRKLTGKSTKSTKFSIY